MTQRKTTAVPRRRSTSGSKRKRTTASSRRKTKPLLKYEILGLILCCLGIFVTIGTIGIDTGSIGHSTDTLFAYVFGIGRIIPALALILLGLRYIIVRQAVPVGMDWGAGCVLFILFLGLVHILFVPEHLEFMPLMTQAGGGVLGGIVAVALRHFLGQTGAVLAIVLMMIVIVMIWKQLSISKSVTIVSDKAAEGIHGACAKQDKDGACRDMHCIGSRTCPNLDTSHDDYLQLLREIRSLKGIKKVFVRSGLRYDYVLADHNKRFVEELCQYHVSGQLKVAPEHVVPHVTDMMGKAGVDAFLKFRDWFQEANQKIGKQQFLVPYFMSSHPGCTLEDAISLAEFLRDQHMQPEQVQDFIPTPGSLSTAMEDVLSKALSRADMVITTGGLGPTQGDMTKIIGAKVLGLPMWQKRRYLSYRCRMTK